MNLLLADFHKCVGYSGGIEHVLSRMAFAMTEKGYTVSVAFCDEKEGPPFFPLPSEVKVYNLCHLEGRPRLRFSRGLKGLREMVRPFSQVSARNVNYHIFSRAAPLAEQMLAESKPDVIISFREPTGRLLLDRLRVRIPVISMLHNDPDEIFLHAPEEEKEALLQSAFIQVLLPSFKEKARKYLRYDRFESIPNAVAMPEKVDPGQRKKIYHISCVGRLTGSTKRQHLLVEAFHQLADRFPDWYVDFWGDTYDKAYTATMKGLIARYGLQERVYLRGVTSDMSAVWKETDIFGFPSHHEGFPLALTEAMGAGIPAVGYRACPAVNELIRDGVNGYLCDDGTESLAEALAALMDDPAGRRRMGAAARADMKAYTPEVVWSQWNTLIRRAAK